MVASKGRMKGLESKLMMIRVMIFVRGDGRFAHGIRGDPRLREERGKIRRDAGNNDKRATTFPARGAPLHTTKDTLLIRELTKYSSDYFLMKP